jgi:acyl-CoA hydrolase
MEHHKLVLPEFLNPGGSLFGGYLLKWIDEVAFMTVSLDFPECSFVTIALENVVFRHRITSGEILRFCVKQEELGNSSVEYSVQVFGSLKDPDKLLFETRITFVNIDDNGTKSPIPKN